MHTISTEPWPTTLITISLNERNAQCLMCIQPLLPKQLPMHWQLLLFVVLLFRCFFFFIYFRIILMVVKVDTSKWSRVTEVHWVGCLRLVSVLFCLLTLPLLKNFFHCLFTMFSIHNRMVTALFQFCFMYSCFSRKGIGSAEHTFPLSTQVSQERAGSAHGARNVPGSKKPVIPFSFWG